MHHVVSYAEGISMQTPKSGAAVQVRLKGPTFASLENWRRAQDKIPARSEALRQLVEKALVAAAAEQSTPAA